MDVLFLMNIFRLYLGFKMSFEHHSVCKNLFLNACFRWDSGLSLREMDKKFKFGALIVWNLYFFTRKYLDCMQNYTMLLEQCGHIVAKDQATAITAIWLGEDQIHVCSVTWLDYSFAFT